MKTQAELAKPSLGLSQTSYAEIIRSRHKKKVSGDFGLKPSLMPNSSCKDLTPTLRSMGDCDELNSEFAEGKRRFDYRKSECSGEMGPIPKELSVAMSVANLKTMYFKCEIN